MPDQVPLVRNCGTMEVHHRLLERNPSFRTRQAKLEDMTSRRAALGSGAFPTETRTIPVVVHVVHRTATENISTEQIKSQIAVLNKDFRAKNPDRLQTPVVWKGLVTDPKIQFKLATKDPKSNATTGIIRVKTTETEFDDHNDAVKSKVTGGSDGWSTDKYLNIWVCTLAGGLLGYAQFPGGPKKTDGVVVLNRAFGTNGTATEPFNLGRTATHEIGHWLNLRHIWGDTPDCSGTDSVSDTPNCAGPNVGKPNFPSVSCSNGPSGDMFMNYMDYVDDGSMFMFTAGQVTRMAACLAGTRASVK